MRVCLVCPYSWSVPGGVQSHVAGLAAALRGLGAEVEILAPADGPAEGVLPLGRSLPVPSNGSVQRVALSPATVARTARLVRSRGYDVVHVHEPFLPAACLTAVVAARVPVVATAHMYRRALLWYAVFAPLVRLAVRRVDVLLAVSAAAAEYVRRGTGRTAEIVPNGIDYAGLASLDGRDRRGGRILFVGRDEPRKGLSVLLRLPPPAGGDGARARRPQRQLRRARAGARPPGGRRPAARARPRGRPRGAVAGRRELRDRAARGDGRRPARRRERHPRRPPARAGGGRPAGAARRPGRPGRRARRAARRRGAAPQAGRGRAPRGRRLRVAASRAARACRLRAGGCRPGDGRRRLRVKGRSARPFTGSRFSAPRRPSLRGEDELVAQRELQPRQGVALELADTLARQPELLADRLERRRLRVEAEAQLDDPPLPLGQVGDRPLDALPAHRLDGLLGGIGGRLVGEQ